MLERENILNELMAISPLLASIPRVNVYEVDENYFDGIRAELQARIIASNFTTEQNNFDVPQGYFENLSNNILEKIKAQENNVVLTEMHQLSPTIAGIGNKNVYAVPKGYFEQLVMPTIASAKVVKMSSLRIFKYAAAAVIIGALGFGGYKFMYTSKTDKETLAVVKEANKILETNSFDETLASISDKDIEKYLSQNGEDVNAAMVAAFTDDVALPEAADYLLDEKTLDNFLNENNLKN
jgi:hypothetical protein